MPDAPAPTTASVAGSSSSAQASSVPMTRPPNCVPGQRLLHRAGREDDGLRLDSVPSKLPPTLTLPSSVSDAVALDDVDAVLLQQPGDAAGQRLDDLLAPLADRGEVDRRLADRDAEVAGLADLLSTSATRSTALAGMQA